MKISDIKDFGLKSLAETRFHETNGDKDIGDSTLGGGFVWKDTPEGHNFWSNVSIGRIESLSGYLNIKKYLDNMKYCEGDIIINNEGDEKIILAKIGAVYVLSNIGKLSASAPYTQEELDDEGFYLKEE